MHKNDKLFVGIYDITNPDEQNNNTQKYKILQNCTKSTKYTASAKTAITNVFSMLFFCYFVESRIPDSNSKTGTKNGETEINI